MKNVEPFICSPRVNMGPSYDERPMINIVFSPLTILAYSWLSFQSSMGTAFPMMAMAEASRGSACISTLMC